jgi:hypothetical protein
MDDSDETEPKGNLAGRISRAVGEGSDVSREMLKRVSESARRDFRTGVGSSGGLNEAESAVEDAEQETKDDLS